MALRHSRVSILATLAATALWFAPLPAQDAPTPTPMTVRPELLNRIEVREALIREYPAQVRDAGISGTVDVWLHLDLAGVVDSAQVAQSSGYRPLDEAALRVAQVMRFSPGRNGDQPTAAWIRVPVRFDVAR